MGRLRHYRHLLLFVAVLIVPSALVAGLGWIVLDQDSASRGAEAHKRADDARSAARAEVATSVRARLENIKRQEAGPEAGTDAAVRFVVWADGERLVMPWDVDPGAEPSRLARDEPEFARKLEDGDFLEIEQRFDQATALYRALLQSSNEYQRAYARLSLAHVLGSSGAQAEAVGVYRDVLSLPSSLVDNEGFPFASTAAVALSNFPREVLARVRPDVETVAALTLDQALRWRFALRGLQGDSAEVKSMIEKLSARIDALNRAKELERNPDLVSLREGFRHLDIAEGSWRPYRDLLISRVTAGPRRLVVAVRVDDILSGLPFSPRAGGESDQALDEQYLPGLRATLTPLAQASAETRDLRRWLYAPSILLVVLLNLLGGYLVWRDTRREVRLAELRAQFVSSVSHELKTPLTSIRMFAEILQNDSIDPQIHAECADTIVNESERLTRLLNNVLDFANVERGQKQYRMDSTRLPEVVAAAVRTMRYPLAAQGFTLRLDIDASVPQVRGDRDALEQAVLNLLTNAMKYSGQSRDIELRLFPQDGEARIAVADHGIGIAAGDQARIFERFYRASVPENQSVAGTGLGLALVDHIVRGHGGRIDVESHPGAGSTFSIRLPIPVGAPS
jgi:two-component system phosphate regulon sensor histidine kinase PhoR